MGCNHSHCENHHHEHGHHHEHEHKESNKVDIILYIISIIIFILTFIPFFENIRFWMYLVVVLLSGYKLFFEGIKNIFKLNFEEETLMTIATVAAFILGEYPESCMVVLLFRLGEFIEDKAVENSNKNIKNIVEIKAKTANVLDENGNEEIVDVDNVQIGQYILIKPGEMVPLDCKIVKGTSNLDTSSLTGESIPVQVGENESILSGSINLNGSLIALVEKDYENSTASKIVDLVYEATNNKGKTEEFITKFSKIYTPVVIVLALIIAIIPPLFMEFDFKTWIMRALVFLVASCPCSIVISVPLAFFSCIGAISKKGMVIKGTKHIEDLAEAKSIAFDKTGTITNGRLKVDKFVTLGNYSEEEILGYLYAVEKNSNHPISTAIKQKVEKEGLLLNYNVDKYEEIAGYGIKAIVNYKEILFGNSKFLEENNIEENIQKDANYIIINGKLEGYITFEEEIRKNSVNTIKKLKALNINEIAMVTGDNESNANKIAGIVGIDKVYSKLLPADKQETIKLMKRKGKVIFVGDGINDSPVLAESNFGISMGEGSEIANSTADGILISNNLETLPKAIKISRKTIGIIKFNIVFSLVIKAVVLTLGLLGIAPIWLAIVADTGVSLFTVLNSIRIFR